MKKPQIFLASLILTSYFLLPTSVLAVTGVGFGGLVSVSVPCTCSGGFWVWFTPLYINSPVPTTGAIYFSAFHTVPYSWYVFGVPGTFELGTFTPGVQECLVATPVGCTILPTLGSMIMVGTSKL